MTSLRKVLAPVAFGVLVLAGCGGSSSPSEARSGAPSSSPSSPGAPSASPPATSAPTTSAPARARTKAELRGALLTLRDLPAGFRVEPPDDSGDDGKVSSSDPRCAPFVRKSNREAPAGTRATAERDFAAKRGLEFVDEGLYAFGGPDAAAHGLAGYRSAATPCHSVRLAIPGAGTFRVRLSPGTAPDVGDEAFLLRIRFVSGQLSGLEFDQVLVRSADIVVEMTFGNAAQADIRAGTRLAVEKVESVLTGGVTA